MLPMLINDVVLTKPRRVRLLAQELPQELWGLNAGFSCKSFSRMHNNYAQFQRAMLEQNEDSAGRKMSLNKQSKVVDSVWIPTLGRICWLVDTSQLLHSLWFSHVAIRCRNSLSPMLSFPTALGRCASICNLRIYS